MSYAFINQSVGKNAKNAKEDVMSIQIRLDRWIMEGKLPSVAMLAVDGDCGAQTKKAIGAFQKLYLGMSNPDCRVDPGGKTLDKLFQSLISPTASREAYEAWLKSQGGSPSNGPTTGWLNAETAAAIRKEWGQQIYDWAALNPNGTEAKEFPPPGNMADKYKTVFVWKSQNANTSCAASPNQRIQVLAMLRDDKAYWEKKGLSHAHAIMAQKAAESAIRDYRDFVVCRKMCPKAAFNRLVGQGKDIYYQMFLGMFQLLSPAGLAGAPASSGALAEITKAVVEGINTGDMPWQPTTDPSDHPYWSRFKDWKCI